MPPDIPLLIKFDINAQPLDDDYPFDLWALQEGLVGTQFVLNKGDREASCQSPEAIR